MRLDFTNVEQIKTFFVAVALGAALCLVYDIMRFMVSSYKSGGIVVFISDTLYFAVAGVVTFVFFQLFSKGTIRFYALLGELIGFTLFRLAFSRLIRGTLKLICRLISKFIKLALKPILWLMALLMHFADCINKFSRKTFNKFGKAIKKLINKFGKIPVLKSKKARAESDKSIKVE